MAARRIFKNRIKAEEALRKVRCLQPIGLTGQNGNEYI